MPGHLLDPTIDIVFKLLLLRRRELLCDMIEAVLDLPFPLRDVEVQNPEIPEDFPGDKSVVLDVRVRLHDGRQIDLEIPSTVPPGTRARFLYYWAKGFADSLARGEEYLALRPCISILWLKEPLLRGDRFHSVFHLAEDETQEVFSPEIEFHVLELPKLSLAEAGGQARLQRWACFLRARTAEELEELAERDAVMSAAKDALNELSSDPTAQRLAREREAAVLMHRHLLSSSWEQGRAEGLLLAVRSICDLLGIELDEHKEAQLSGLDRERLERLVEELRTRRRWPATV